MVSQVTRPQSATNSSASYLEQLVRLPRLTAGGIGKREVKAETLSIRTRIGG